MVSQPYIFYILHFVITYCFATLSGTLSDNYIDSKFKYKLIKFFIENFIRRALLSFPLHHKMINPPKNILYLDPDVELITDWSLIQFKAYSESYFDVQVLLEFLKKSSSGKICVIL